METRGSGIVLGPIRTLFSEGRIGSLSDAQLLEQFVARRAQASAVALAAGETFRRRSRGFSHSITLQLDGSFRVDEVQPGTYVLHVRVPFFAKLSREMSIPELMAGQAGTPVNLDNVVPRP